MSHTLLIANRGEIACRIAATARRMGWRTVAVYSAADAKAMHVQACDEAWPIGPSEAQASYLNVDAILAVAQASGATMLHPGYGFLSENADLARACAARGLTFVGPSAQAIEAMGLKVEAKALMQRAGVPVLPGYDGSSDQPEAWLEHAERVGYPVMLKASAGGGGKGIRVVRQAQDLLTALASCRREAKQSFGDDHVLLEKMVERPRHIEVQVFGDSHGHIVHLHERDCSIQRRHQKIWEEAPAPGLDAELRQRLGHIAVAAAQAVGYVGAGTVEFIVQTDARGALQPYFMEMNTRLQVEHPITEAITGLDLVEWQLRVAAGEPLPLLQPQVPAVQGHAIEVRLCAENPERDFLPATGVVEVLRQPPDAQAFVPAPVRWDGGIVEGDTVTPYYDSMVAKLIVHGVDRDDALQKMRQALQQTQLHGVPNNVSFLRRLAQAPSVVHAELATDLLPRESAFLQSQANAGLPWEAAAVHAWRQLAAVADSGDLANPWQRYDAWQMGEPRQVAHRWQEGDTEWRVLASDAPSGSTLSVWRNDAEQVQDLSMQLQQATRHGEAPDWRLQLLLGGRRATVWVWPRADRLHLATPNGQATWVAHGYSPQAAQAEGGLQAPMPGKVLALRVQVGDAVRAGDTLAVLEAMKMEHNLIAPHDGVVTEVLAPQGSQIAQGQAVLTVEPAQQEST